MNELQDHDPRLPPQLAEIATIHFVSFIVGKHPELLSDFFVKELGRCRDRSEVDCFQQNSVPKFAVPGMVTYWKKGICLVNDLVTKKNSAYLNYA